MDTREHWNERVDKYRHDEKTMIWCHTDFDTFTEEIKEVLLSFKDMEVIDIGCGYGRFAPCFSKEKYLGMDFSDKLIELAQKKYPDYAFIRADLNEFIPEKKVDVIFGVMTCGPSGTTQEEFIERFKPYAKEAVLCLEPGSIRIVKL